MFFEFMINLTRSDNVSPADIWIRRGFRLSLYLRLPDVALQDVCRNGCLGREKRCDKQQISEPEFTDTGAGVRRTVK